MRHFALAGKVLGLRYWLYLIKGETLPSGRAHFGVGSPTADASAQAMSTMTAASSVALVALILGS